MTAPLAAAPEAQVAVSVKLRCWSELLMTRTAGRLRPPTWIRTGGPGAMPLSSGDIVAAATGAALAGAGSGALEVAGTAVGSAEALIASDAGTRAAGAAPQALMRRPESVTTPSLIRLPSIVYYL